MSDAIKPPLHGRDHLAGGQDPIPGLPTGKVQYLNVEEHFVGSFGMDTQRIANFTGVTPRTNDDGTTYSWNFATDPNRISVLKSGFYLFRPYWWIITFTGGHYPWWFNMTYAAPSDAGNDPENVNYWIAGTNSFAVPIPTLVDLHPGWISAPPMSVGNIATLHHSDVGTQTITEFYAGFTIVRLGDI